jgi:hypothetical protein
MTRCATGDGERAPTTLIHKEPPAEGREGRRDVDSRARRPPAPDLQQSRKRRCPWRERPTEVRARSQRAQFEPEQTPQVQERPHRRQGDKRHCPAWRTRTIDRPAAPRGWRCLEGDGLRTDCHEPGVQKATAGSIAPSRQLSQVRTARYRHQGEGNGGQRSGQPFLGAHPSRQPKPQRRSRLSRWFLPRIRSTA